MRIEIYSDTICPWCLIGKRRLERALQARPQSELELIWRAFQLNPNMPPEGLDRDRYLELKFGGTERARQVYEPIAAAGESEGIPFDFENIGRTPNTAASHRLIRMAQEAGRAEAATEKVFSAYFFEGRDIGDPDVLADIAAAVGLSREQTAARLAGTEGLLEVLAEDARAREIGIQGVPTFIFEGKYVLSGAHPPEVIFQMFDLVANGGQEDAGTA